jgi:spore germination protein GerM
VLKVAIEELLKGLASKEKDLGFIELIDQDVMLNSAKIENGIATIDLSKDQSGGSCRVALIESQIINTAKQFSNVNNVIISVNGRTGDILQP